MNSPWMLTHSGIAVPMLTPRPEQIAIEDIAWHLAHIRRFNGATVQPISVAQHSIAVADAVPTSFRAAALLHDAHEAYLGDIIQPIKEALGMSSGAGQSLRILAHRFDLAICKRFDIPQPLLSHTLIMIADLRALAAERRDFMPAGGPHWKCLDGIDPLPPHSIYTRATPEVIEEFLGLAREYGIE